MNNPIWKPVDGFENAYEVSDEGTVRRIASPYRAGHRQGKISRLVRPSTNEWGYFRITMTLGKLRSVRTVHSMVAAAFIGPRPVGYEVNHIDRNRQNNRLENLEYVTRHGNVMHWRSMPNSNVNFPRGEAHHNRKLDEGKVRDIRLRLAAKQSMESIGAVFGIRGATVAQIRDHKTWKHVKD